jgi:hypothetical protein
VIAVVKQLEVHRGQLLLVDDSRCFFTITNDFEKPADQVIFEAKTAVQPGEPLRPPQDRPAGAVGAC